MLSTLGRLIWVPIAFVLSGVATAFFLFYIAQERFFQAAAGKGPDSATLLGMFELFREGRVLMSGMMIVPALAVIIIGEVARVRSVLYYLVGGGLALVAVPMLARYGQVGTGASISTLIPPTLVWQVFATAGFLGGWVYWFLAGRNS